MIDFDKDKARKITGKISMNEEKGLTLGNPKRAELQKCIL